MNAWGSSWASNWGVSWGTGAPVVIPPLPIFSGGWFYKKKKKKKKAPAVELENVVVIPQKVPDLEDKRIYRYFGDLSKDLVNLRVQMISSRDAMDFAKRENKRLQDDELLILLAIDD